MSILRTKLSPAIKPGKVRSIALAPNFAASLRAMGELAEGKQPTDLSAEQLKTCLTL